MQPEWEIWIDSNISPIVAKCMYDELGLNAKSSYSLQLHYLTDGEIYNKAKTDGKHVILVSKDSDFSELINRSGSPSQTYQCENWKYP